MKISPEEIVAASDAFLKNGYLSEALEAAYTVRRARKQAKHDRQRKEKDKQVVESVAGIPIECGIDAQGRADMIREFNSIGMTSKSDIERAKNVLHRNQLEAVMATPSKAPEWDGTFGVGEWSAIGGERVCIDYRDGTLMLGTIGSGGDSTWYSKTGKNVNDDRRDLDLIRPWPKGEQ